MVYQTGMKLADTEDKENLELDRKNLLQFQQEAKEILHIDKYINVKLFLKEYERQHAYLSKNDLTIRLKQAEELLYFIVNYK